jgi:hypothetical protein
LNVAGLSLALIESQSSKFFLAKPEQYQFLHQNNETKPKHISVNTQERFIIGKDAIAAAVYSPTL